MVGIYAPKLQGKGRQARLDAIAELLCERGIPFDISDPNQSGTDRSGTGGNKTTGQDGSSSSAQRQGTAKNGFTGAGGRGLPVITMFGCPYPELAEQDRSICALERMVFSGILDQDVRLTTCRLDGDRCCEFEAAL